MATQVSGGIRVDGVLDEETWRLGAAATDFTQSEPRDGQPASEQTEVRIAFDDQFLYIGARMRDSDPSHEIVNDIRKDFREDDQDDFEVIIDTFRDRRNGYVFIVNPEGGRADRQIANEGRDINASWDAVWDVKTQRTTTAGRRNSAFHFARCGSIPAPTSRGASTSRVASAGRTR